MGLLQPGCLAGLPSVGGRGQQDSGFLVKFLPWKVLTASPFLSPPLSSASRASPWGLASPSCNRCPPQAASLLSAVHMHFLQHQALQLRDGQERVLRGFQVPIVAERAARAAPRSSAPLGSLETHPPHCTAHRDGACWPSRRACPGPSGVHVCGHSSAAGKDVRGEGCVRACAREDGVERVSQACRE